MQQQKPQADDHLSVTAAAVSQRVRRVLVMNAKGGCGKTTIATNLAS